MKREKFLPRRRRTACAFGPGEALKTIPWVHERCGDCPKYETRKTWCPVQASLRTPNAPACRYGMSLMDNIPKGDTK